MLNARKITAAVTLLAIILFSWFSWLDMPATQRVDDGFKRALLGTH